MRDTQAEALLSGVLSWLLHAVRHDRRPAAASCSWECAVDSPVAHPPQASGPMAFHIPPFPNLSDMLLVCVCMCVCSSVSNF